MVVRLTEATDTYARSWKELGVLTLISVFFVHLMTVAAFGCLTVGLGLEIPVFTLVAAVTIGNIVGLIPIFPSGVGGRDVAIITILAARRCRRPGMPRPRSCSTPRSCCSSTFSAGFSS